MDRATIESHWGRARNAIQASVDDNQDWIVSYLNETHQQRMLDDCQLIDGLLGAKQDSIILDLGAAPFYTGLTLKNMGYPLVAVDIMPERFGGFTEKIGIEVVKCDIEREKLPFPDDHFDVILLAEVFEHLRIDLIFTLSEIRRVLKPGGKLVLSTPNFFDFTRFGQLVFHQRTTDIHEAYRKLHEVGHMGHVREYTLRDVVTFLEKNDFSIERSYYRGVSHVSGKNLYQLRRKLIQRFIPFLRIWFVIVASKQ